MPILVTTYRNHRLTRLVYWLLFFHALIILLGAHYTYARVPIGYWLQDALSLSRNNYDRLGHLAQGFIPAMLTREILIRYSPVGRSGWLFVFVTAICLSVSVFYEFFEWWAALIMGGEADDFLALQGDAWDTQWDMFLALIGAVSAQLLLAHCHIVRSKAWSPLAGWQGETVPVVSQRRRLNGMNGRDSPFIEVSKTGRKKPRLLNDSVAGISKRKTPWYPCRRVTTCSFRY